MGQGDEKGEACNGRALPTCCFAPSPTSAPAKQGTTGEISSRPSALLLRYPVPLQICLVSRGPDLRVGKCCVNTSPALGRGMTVSPALGEGAAGACVLCSRFSTRSWVAVCDLPPCPLREGASLPLCLVQLGSGRGGTRHAALQRQARYTGPWLRLAAIIQDPRRKWPDFTLPAR